VLKTRVVTGVMAILLTAMINRLVGMRMGRVISGNRPIDDLSYEKPHDALALHHRAAKRWEELLTFTPFTKHVARDKRKRKSPVTPGAFGLG